MVEEEWGVSEDEIDLRKQAQKEQLAKIRGIQIGCCLECLLHLSGEQQHHHLHLWSPQSLFECHLHAEFLHNQKQGTHLPAKKVSCY